MSSDPTDQKVTTQDTNRRGRARGAFSGLRIRKKLIVLHTSFSLVLGVLLLVALSPAMGKMVDGAEQDLAELVYQSELELADSFPDQRVHIRSGSGADFGMSNLQIDTMQTNPAELMLLTADSFGAGVIGFNPEQGIFIEIRARSDRARTMVQMIYGLLIGTLLAGYLLVALALEIFVLPQHVYLPIRAMLDADDAARSMDSDHEIIPESLIPADELGEIMDSRNQTVAALREHQKQLSETLVRLEHVAIDLHTKNRLLETARKNLEGADRLATMGMMSAGIAHELNTPLSVVKGLVEKIEAGNPLSDAESKLLARVVGRIEKLSEGLLDFARVRPPRLVESKVHQIIEDAWVLVRLDRQNLQPSQRLQFANDVPQDLVVACDPDRMVQVFVNLIKNGVHALRELQDRDGSIRVWSSIEERSDGRWVVISVQDNGGGIDPEMIDSIFEPFVSSKMDAKGTGLGLGVAEGIVREHGGMVVPSNTHSDSICGARFDVHLPINDQV